MTRFLVALIEDRRVALGTAGALALIGGSVAPWAHVPFGPLEITELGLDADGKVTLVLGALALALVVAFAFLGQRDLAAGAALAAIASAALVIVYEVNLRRASGRVVSGIVAVDPGSAGVQFAARTGIGVWLCIAGAATLAVAAVSMAVAGRSRVRAPTPG